MQDASQASTNAAYKVFGDSIKVLMCWFHLKKNVKSHLHLVPVEKQDEISKHILNLHMTVDREDFHAKWRDFVDKWKVVCSDFVRYFHKTWVKCETSQKFWRIFDSPNGFANTNRPIESFNAT